MGRFMTNAMIAKLFIRTQQTEKQLFREVGDCGEYAYQDNGSKVLAVAHCDYVDCGSNHFYFDYPNVDCSRLDDRLGVHAILDWLPAMGVNVDVLLTTDEEIGQSTAQAFKTDKQYNWMFSFDRRGTDAVTYGYDDMDPYAKEFFKVGYGSFSDICSLEHLGVCGLNVGTGYYNEHTTSSYCDLRDFCGQLRTFRRFFQRYQEIRIDHNPSPNAHWWDDRNPYNDIRVFPDGTSRSDYGAGHSWRQWLDDADYRIANDYAMDIGYRGLHDFMKSHNLTTEQEGFDVLEARCLANIS